MAALVESKISSLSNLTPDRVPSFPPQSVTNIKMWATPRTRLLRVNPSSPRRHPKHFRRK